MTSSRRVAREWALKILYQADVARSTVEESEILALERLRREFVQRGARVSDGSFLEEYCLEEVTSRLRGLLPSYDAALDGAIRAAITQLFDLTDFWRDLDVQFEFSRQSFNALLAPPRAVPHIVLPAAGATLPAVVLQDARLTAEQRAEIRDFLGWSRDALANTALRAYAREGSATRPDGANMRASEEHLREHWRHFSADMAERWKPAGAVVSRQTADWIKVAAFTTHLAEGVWANRSELDARLEALASGWSVERQASVDRNILRMAVFELLHMEGIPASATINEAVEIAKKYSTGESGRFVNGVLGALANQLGASLAAQVADDEADSDVIDTEVEVDEIEDHEELTHA